MIPYSVRGIRILQLLRGLLSGAVLGAVAIFYFTLWLSVTLPMFRLAPIRQDYSIPVLFDGLIRHMLFGALFGGALGAFLACLRVRRHQRIGRFVSLAIGYGFYLWILSGALYRSALERPLWEAISHGNYAAVQTLLDKGVDVNALDAYSDDVDQEDGPSHTIFALAARKDEKDIVLLMLKHGADVNASAASGKTPLIEAAGNSHSDMVQLLIEHGADVRAKDSFYSTALMDAASLGDVASCRILLEHGADVDAADYNGGTALMDAAFGGQDEAIRFLLAHGANLHATNSFAETAAAEAALGKHSSTLRLLRGRGLKLDVFETAILGDTEALNALLRSGDYIDKCDVNGRTPLINAAIANSPQTIRLLIAHGANINATDFYGRSALMLAYDGTESDEQATIETLLQCGANINLADNDGETALMRYVSFGKASIVAALLRHHADTTLRDKGGETALYHARAIYDKNKNIIAALEKAHAPE